MGCVARAIHASKEIQVIFDLSKTKNKALVPIARILTVEIVYEVLEETSDIEETLHEQLNYWEVCWCSRERVLPSDCTCKHPDYNGCEHCNNCGRINSELEEKGMPAFKNELLPQRRAKNVSLGILLTIYNWMLPREATVEEINKTFANIAGTHADLLPHKIDETLNAIFRDWPRNRYTTEGVLAQMAFKRGYHTINGLVLGILENCYKYLIAQEVAV